LTGRANRTTIYCVLMFSAACMFCYDAQWRVQRGAKRLHPFNSRIYPKLRFCRSYCQKYNDSYKAIL